MRGVGIRVAKGKEVKRAGGVGLILGNLPDSGNERPLDFHVLPGTVVSSDDTKRIIQYIKSTKNPTAIISPGKTVFNAQPAPSMAAFTSRGPNPIDPNILKVTKAEHWICLCNMSLYSANFQFVLAA